jgi:Rrf2 family protein
MRLQKSSQFALYAVLELASDPGRQLSTAEIAEIYGISSHHLAKVMRTLVRAGMIQSVRGAGGGYRFAANAARTTLLDVIELFETLEPEFEVAFERGAGQTPVGAALQAVSEEINELANATLQSISLKSLLKYAPRPERDARDDSFQPLGTSP